MEGMNDKKNSIMERITINFISTAFMMAPVCSESSIRLLGPKPQVLLWVFLFPDEANSLLLFSVNTQ